MMIKEEKFTSFAVNTNFEADLNEVTLLQSAMSMMKTAHNNQKYKPHKYLSSALRSLFEAL